MDFKTYQSKCMETATFPYLNDKEGSKLEDMPLYQGLGVIGESAEVAEKIWQYSDEPDSEKSIKLFEEIIKEFGDQWWYFATTCQAIGVSFEELFDGLEIYPIKNLKMINTFPFMLGAMKIAEILKKSWHKDVGGMSAVNKKKLFLQMKICMSYSMSLIKYLDISTDKIMEDNLAKLQKRKVENKIIGEGDNR